MGTSYLYFNCGCSFSVEDGEWDNEKLCKYHEKKICKEDLGAEE